MRYLYNKVEQILNTVNFNDIWDGFSKYEFALYDEETVYLEADTIPVDNRFLGNTAIDYNGRLIAIWKILNPLEEDTEYLASNLVHEMFHVFQKSKSENRFPNDLIMLSYPDSIDNFIAKRRENQAVCNAFLSENEDEKLGYLISF